MAITFIGLLYIEVNYMEDMMKISDQQFDHSVRRSLHGVSRHLENDETQYFLQQNEINTRNARQEGNRQFAIGNEMEYHFTTPVGVEGRLTLQGDPMLISRLTDSETVEEEVIATNITIPKNDKKNIEFEDTPNRQNLLENVILNISTQASNRPLLERADTTKVAQYIGQELRNIGLELPYEFSIVDRNNIPVYSTKGFVDDDSEDGATYTQMLFINDPQPNKVMLKVYFPSKDKYLLKSIRFLLPAFIFTIILLGVFVYIIIIAFRQKKINEMKTDFINNMTHEFKTPISTISLAAQMLNDDSVRKSSAMLQHISSVINDETKRLRFQVEKVLQMSMFDRKDATVRLQEIDANSAIHNIVNTFKLKVEKYGGSLSCNLDAENAIVMVDEMHFTNVIYNLLDNAVKYRRENEPLRLNVSTEDISDNRLRITISDNGIGIKKENLKRIFDKFYRVPTGNTHNVKGFGLGLAYVRKMVTILGGSIKAESEINQGSKFIIILPLTKN